MGWWPFSRKSDDTKPSHNVHIKGTRVWIQELQQACEKYYNLPPQAHSVIREMQIEWGDAYRNGDINKELFDGLELSLIHI